MKDKLSDTMRQLFWADAYMQQEGSDFGAVPLIISIAHRLASGEITDAEAVDELATLVAEGTVDARLLGSSGDHPAVIKAVTDKLLATSSLDSLRSKVADAPEPSIDRDDQFERVHKSQSSSLTSPNIAAGPKKRS